MIRRPSLKRENVTVISNGEDIKHAKVAWSKSDLNHNQTKDYDVALNDTFIFSSDNLNNIYTYA